MGKQNQLKRNFSISDDEMIEAARTKREFFIEDKADFVAFDADFDDPFADDWDQAIDPAEAYPSDETIDDQTIELTEAVETAMESCRRKFQDTKYFIEKAFPGNRGVQHSFGMDDYKDSRDNQSKFLKFMRIFKETADQYDTELIAAGYTQPKIDEIEPLRMALLEANKLQEKFLNDVPLKTQTRIELHNAAWTFSIKACTAGKRIYQDNYGKYHRYLLPPGDESKDVLRISGTMTDSVTNAPLKNVVVVMEPGGYTDKTRSDGKYGFGLIDNGSYDLTFSCLNYTPQTFHVDLLNDNDIVEANFGLVHL